MVALLPLIARALPGGGAGSFTLLLAAMGSGAILAVMMMPRLRGLVKMQQWVTLGTLLYGAGATVAALKKALNGTASLNLKDGALKGINLAESFRKAKAALGAKGGGSIAGGAIETVAHGAGAVVEFGAGFGFGGVELDAAGAASAGLLGGRVGEDDFAEG